MSSGTSEMRRRLRRLRKRLVRGPRALFERGAVWLAWWILPSLPRVWIDGLADALGPLYLRLAGRDRAVMRANLDLVFGRAGTPDALRERRRLERDIGRNAVRVLLDCFWFARDTRRRLQAHVTLDEASTALARTPGAFLAVTGHLGTWELVAQSLCLGGRRGTCVYAPIGSAVTQRFLLRMRMQNGQELVPREGALVPLLRALKRGDVVGLLLDQRTPLHEGGLFVDFLGRKTTMSKAAGMLSVRMGVPVHLLLCRCLDGGRYRVELFRSLPPGHGLAADAVNQWVSDALGDAVRAMPEQWLWMYRRWRHVPPGEDPAAYPFYARPFDPACD